MSGVPKSVETPHDCQLETEDFDAENLGVRRVEGYERISSLYRFDVALAQRHGEAAPIDPDDVIGSSVTVAFFDEGGAELRRINGVVTAVRLRTDGLTPHPAYDLEIKPTAHRLEHFTTQEIFMDMTVPEIIAEKLKRHHLEGYYDLRTTGDYPKREFVVQYKESDLAFISRIAEHAGLAYWFEQGDDGETMVFSDHNGAFESFGEVPYVATGDASGVFDLATRSCTVPGLHVVSDYNYRRPELDLGVAVPLDAPGTVGGFVEYGSHHKSPEEGNALAKIRAEEAQCRRRQHDGKSAVAGLGAGMVFHLDDHPFVGSDSLLVIEVRHHFEQTFGTDDADTQGYRNELLAIPAAHTYRPPRTTPRPRIYGVVSGIVQPGPDGEVGGVARLDDQGRYTVQFHYDTTQAGEKKASRPVRMAQPFAGTEEGMHFPLAPGTEVLLIFIDGDPDRPIIVGALANPHTPSPVTATNSEVNRIQTASGVLIQFGRDD